MESTARPRVAAIVTAYYPRSHADVIVSKLLADYTHPAPRDLSRFDFHRTVRGLTEAPLPVDEIGRLRRPRVQVVSMYTDQVPENDISREWSARSGVPIFPTIREALTLGGDALAVDGVLVIGEHGDYPYNERNQKQYPRRRLFEAVVDVMRESGRFVPIFNDKHLGYAWEDARWMVDSARRHGIPLAAGSSISVCPVAWREPALQLPLGIQLQSAMAVGHGGLEAYGFHTLEVLQCMVERRAGGETGVAAVQALAGDAMWEAAAAGQWDQELLAAALATQEEAPPADLRTAARHPAVYLIEYRDGLAAAVPMLDGVARSWLFACRLAPAGGSATTGTAGAAGGVGAAAAVGAAAGTGAAEAANAVGAPSSGKELVVATRFRSQGGEPFGHFAWLCEDIQDLICTGREPHPAERTLLTTGILDRAMESLWRGGARLATPELAVRYQVTV